MTRTEEVREATEEIREAFERLIPQLSPFHPAPEIDLLWQVIRSPGTRLFVARDADRRDAIAGTLTLVLFRIPTGLRARIEDVVVEEKSRGKGLGESLVRKAIACAREAGADTVELTSNPERKAAARLYTRLGFREIGTRLYRFTLADPRRQEG